MTINLRWTASGILLGLSALIILTNLWFSVRWYLSQERALMIPFIGGFAGMIGLLLLPASQATHFWWIPALLDLGCGLFFVALMIAIIKKWRRR